MSSDTNTILDTHVCKNNICSQSSGIIKFLCKHYMVIRLLDVVFLLLAVIMEHAVILPELHENPRRKV